MTTKATILTVLYRRILHNLKRPHCNKLFPLSLAAELKVCCDANQIFSMNTGMNQADGVYSRCPTCVFNMGLSICYMTCAQNQSDFLVPYDSIYNGVEYVEKIDFRIDDNFAKMNYDNCKGIQHTQTGRPAMDLACAPYNAKSCDHRKWYNFMGDVTISDYVPFPINYIFLDETSEEGRLLLHPLPCSQAYQGSYACSCVDCEDSCAIGNAPTGVEDGFMIAGLYGITFIVALVVGVLIIVLIFCGSFNVCRLRFAMPACCGGIRGVNTMMYKGFRAWGVFCAKNPILVIAISSWVIGGLSYGIRYLDVTTDPVELWAGEQSQTRLEKEYFDSHFGPFYRTNQLFIKPRNMTYVSLRH